MSNPVVEVPNTKANFTEEELHNIDEVGWVTSMIIVMLGNYAQTGHYGGPLAYTPANVIIHLAGAKNGGLAYDIRNPKHPLTDKYMLAGGHCAPTNYALWMVLYEALQRQYNATNDEKYNCNPKHAFYSIDCLGFRRSPGVLETLLKDHNLEDNPIFSQHKIRGIRALMGHSETTDVTNDVNGGPSGIGAANTAGKCIFWDKLQVPYDIKVIMFEGEFAFTEGHAQELKTMALAQRVGKRLRLFFSYNNAGIDDSLIGGVINEQYAAIYDMCAQFTSYGWNVFHLKDGANYEELASFFKTMEEWPQDDLRPMVLIANTIKGWWPGTNYLSSHNVNQLIGFPSHPGPVAHPYFISLAESFEERFGVKFEGIKEGRPNNEAARLIEFKTNIDIALSVLDRDNGKLRSFVADRLLQIADEFHQSRSSDAWKTAIERFNPAVNPFEDARLVVANLPIDPIDVTMIHPTTGKEVKLNIRLFRKPGEKMGGRRAISEIGKWCNYVTNNRWITIAADLSGSINVEAAHFTGHYDPVKNPQGSRLKAGIQEACNASTITGLLSQTISEDPSRHVGFWGVSGTYGAFTPLMYTPLRIFSQQNQESPFKIGVITIIAGHSGPETAADGRSHFGIFAPQCWNLFPRNQIINLYFWDYNDVAPGYFAAAQYSLRNKTAGIIVIHVARPDNEVADRSTFADTDLCAAAKGCYLIRDYNSEKPRHGTVIVQGTSSTVNLLKVLPKLEEQGYNLKIVSFISEELFRDQPQDYQQKVLPASAMYDCMFITTFTKRIPPLAGLGPLTEEYSLSSDFDDKWRTGGAESDIIKEAHLDTESIFNGVKRFADDRESRLNRIRSALLDL